MENINWLERLKFVLIGIVAAAGVSTLVFIGINWMLPAGWLPPIVNKSILWHTPSAGKTPPALNMPVGVMIENELMARPFQKGLSEAQVVYEAPTEGRITRFLAVFRSDKLPEKFGPIRSARSYFLDWMHEYKGAYVHVGGHSDVLARLYREKIFNADQFLHEGYFWRENVARTALEHTMFSGKTAIQKLIADQKWIYSPPAHLLEGTAQMKNLSQAPYAAEITVNFGHPTYKVSYQYDAAAGKYLRFQSKMPHMDQLNQRQISPSVVIVQYVKSWGNGDAAGSISIKTIDEGKAVVFMQGRALETKWKKAALEAPTEFFDADGNEIALPAGQVWIEVVPVSVIPAKTGIR